MFLRQGEAAVSPTARNDWLRQAVQEVEQTAGKRGNEQGLPFYRQTEGKCEAVYT